MRIVDQVIAEAQDPKTSEEKLAEFAKHLYWRVRLKVAENPNTSTETLIFLSENRDRDVRAAVARHSNVPKRILKNLLKDSESLVQEAAREALARLEKNSG